MVVKTKVILIPVTWTITLERLETTADVKCDFLLRQVEQLTVSNKELSARLKSIEEIFGAPERVERPLFAAVNVPNFTISADRRTVSKNPNTNCAWQGFLSEHSIAAMGNKFTVALANWGTNLMVGVARRGIDPTGGLYSKAGSWMLYFSGGSTHCFYSNGGGAAVSTRIETSNGSQITVRLDPFNEQIYFKINGSVLYTGDIPKPFCDLYAAVDFNEASQSISFV